MNGDTEPIGVGRGVHALSRPWRWVAATFGVLQIYRNVEGVGWKLARSIWNKKTGGDGHTYVTLADS